MKDEGLKLPICVRACFCNTSWEFTPPPQVGALYVLFVFFDSDELNEYLI